MPQVYDAPVGPMPKTGAPMPSTSLIGQVMTGMPIPDLNFNGGSAAPSGATASTGTNFIYSNSGNSGAWLFISIAALIGFVVWKKKQK